MGTDASSGRHFLGVDWKPSRHHPPDPGTWPFDIPAVAQIIEDGGLELRPGVTFLVGENGSGKSTLVEALAAVYPRHGFQASFPGVVGADVSDEDSPLRWHLRPRVQHMASRAGFFLRAETMHGYFAGIDADPNTARSVWDGEKLQHRSHGESFLAVLRHKFTDVGVYFLDEPEAALSFRSCLGLLALLDMMRREGSQVVAATHSPLLVTLPEATLLELGDWGIRSVPSYEDLDLIQTWRSYLDAPGRFLRHLLEG
ncbi:MAG: AAA family ATPase [Actinomycetota bacterium]|nr:AAA family ATPase [Actinomycetota bacterium]